MTPAAELAGVSHRYGRSVALDDVSVAIPGGCLAGLIGPDGVGKSTILALLSGVRAIQTGNIRCLGGDMSDAAHRQASRARIGYMPQGLGRNLYPTLSVFENLDFFGRLFDQRQAERNERIAGLLTATGLAPYRDRLAGQLSGGMKQKLALCCALIHDPDLLILDEPTTGVDPLSRRQFWSLINAMRQQHSGMSVIVATAYMDEAENFDWLAAMNEGRLIATGTPAAIRASTGAATLEDAFIGLMPEALQQSHKRVVIPTRIQNDGPPAIEANGLTKRFGTFVAVNDVSFRIEAGEIFGFLGSNGCGKSTTMKMLTGLLPPSEGTAHLLGKPITGQDIETRKRIGYMSQSFSLYRELTVRQNLDLHARLFDLPVEDAERRIGELMDRYGLSTVSSSRPDSLPLGIRQRLQLAVAVLHRPDILILDEPTSGVDPIARDRFWQSLVDLSREDGVTIFISTHFMNEAERCDRISLMHAGRVLAAGTPKALTEAKGASSLDDAFIAYLEEAAGTDDSPIVAPRPTEPTPTRTSTDHRSPFSLGRWWAYARRETVELLRDRLRLTFAFAGPIIMLITFGFGISFDVENLPYAALDQDRTNESRQLLESFEGSRYFNRRPPITDAAQLDARLRSGELALAIEIPAGFGAALVRAEGPEVAIWLDGAMPFRADTMRGYVSGLAMQYLDDQARRSSGSGDTVAPVTIETRFRYNQDFRSVFAIVPGVIMLMLVLIPAMMTAVAVVREKETGSIANFRSTPVTRLEFLLGKQAPYVAIAFLSFLSLAVLSLVLFGVGVRGSMLALLAGVIVYVLATTGFGLLVSSFMNTQVAAIFATAIISIVPAVNFSGLLTPVSSLSGLGRAMGLAFPAAWFQQISVGAFTKGLRLADLWPNHLALAGFGVVFMLAAVIALRKQEP